MDNDKKDIAKYSHLISCSSGCSKTEQFLDLLDDSLVVKWCSDRAAVIHSLASYMGRFAAKKGIPYESLAGALYVAKDDYDACEEEDEEEEEEDE